MADTAAAMPISGISVGGPTTDGDEVAIERMLAL
jgi:hypothetical protein